MSPQPATRLAVPESPSAPPATALRGRRLLLARVAWVAVAVLTAGVFISGIPGEFARLRAPCTNAISCVWFPRLTTENARELGLSVDFFAAYFVAVEVAFMAVSFAIGAIIFWRRSDDRMALLVSLMLITFGAGRDATLCADTATISFTRVSGTT